MSDTIKSGEKKEIKFSKKKGRVYMTIQTSLPSRQLSILLLIIVIIVIVGLSSMSDETRNMIFGLGAQLLNFASQRGQAR